jgi:hypothetical protein
MAKYALIDESTRQILQFQDSDLYAYGEVGQGRAAVKLTETEYKKRKEDVAQMLSETNKVVSFVMPEPTEEEREAALCASRKMEIFSLLDRLDRQSARPVRGAIKAILTGEEPDENDVARIEAMEDEAQALRDELAALA